MLNDYVILVEKYSTSKFLGGTLERLVKEYRITGDEEIFGVILYKVKGFVMNMTKMYYSIEKEDLMSIILEKVFTAIKTWDCDRTKFLTYLGTLLRNECGYHIRTTLNNKNRLLTESTSWDELESIEMLVTDYSSDEFFSIEFLKDECNLLESEYMALKLISEGYKVKEVEKLLNCTKRGISTIMRELKGKLSDYYYIENKEVRI